MNIVFKFASRIIVMVAGASWWRARRRRSRADARVREVYLGSAHHG